MDRDKRRSARLRQAAALRRDRSSRCAAPERFHQRIGRGGGAWLFLLDSVDGYLTEEQPQVFRLSASADRGDLRSG